MKAFFLLFFSLVLPFTASAQKYEITLSDQRASKLIPNIEIASVVDLRYDKTNIGWVQKGMSNTKIQADLAGGLEKELKEFLHANAAPVGGSLPVIVKVNKFTISERTIGDREYATAEIALEFLTQGYQEKDYCLLLQTGTSVESSSMTDVTGSHAKNLAAALEECFTQASALKFSEICAKNAPVPASFLQVNSYYKIDPQRIPVLAAPTPQRGVYLTFQEFRNNAPSLNKEVTMNKNGNFFYKETGKKVKDFWGFSDGSQAYIRFGTEQNLFPLTKKADHFTFVGNVSATNSGAVVFGSLVGGLAGGLIAGALTENTRAFEFSLNPVTGTVNPIQNFGPEADLNKTSKVVIYRNLKNERPEPLKVVVNDSLAVQLPAGSFSEFSFKVPVSEKSICIEASQNTCQKIIPILDRTLYYECSLPAKGTGKPVFKPVTAQEAEYYLKIIKHYQSKQMH